MVVGLRADDYPVLEHCRDQTGLGRLQFVRQGDNNPRWNWSVDTRPDTQALVQVLDIYSLRSKKARDYAFWRQVVLDRATWCYGHRNDYTLLLRLSRELKAGRTYDPSYESNAAFAAQKGRTLNVAA